MVPREEVQSGVTSTRTLGLSREGSKWPHGQEVSAPSPFILKLSPSGLPGLVCGPSAGAPHILWWRTLEAQHSSYAFPRGLFSQKPASFKPEAPSKPGKSPDEFWADLLVKLEERQS